MNTLPISFFSDNVVNNLTFIITLISALVLAARESYKFRDAIKSSELKDFMLLAEKMELFNLDAGFKQKMNNEFKRLSIQVIRGFEITEFYDNLLEESGIFKHYSSANVKMISKYLDFYNDEMNIEFSLGEKIVFWLAWFWAGTLLAIGFINYITLDYALNNPTYYLYGGVYIFMMLVGFYIIYTFVTPFILAKKIKRKLLK